MKRFVEGECRDQSVLFPERLDDWIAEDNLPFGIPLLALDSHRITTRALKDHLVADLRLREGFRDRALDILSPDLARAVWRFEPERE